MKCLGCGSEAVRTRTRCVGGEICQSCNVCDGRGAGTSVPVDAAGQPISFPNGGFYSVALGDRWWGSKREFVDYVQKNNFVARPDMAMGRKGRDHNGTRNAPRARR